MIGLSGVISFQRTSTSLEELASSFNNRINGEMFGSISISDDKCSLKAFDEDFSDCVNEVDNILAVLV